jgi:TetR/AcrR family transcriptional repressor of nem operon
MVPRRLTAQGAATRARIVDAAADLMYAQGVTHTNLDAILAASGTSKSQLYHYFADKEDLVLAVIQRQTERVLAAQEPQLHQLDSLEALRRWSDRVQELAARRNYADGCPLGSLASELAESSRPRALLAAGFRTWESYLVAGFTAMGHRDEMKPGTDPVDLATAVMTALEGGLLLSQTTRSGRPLELALDMALDHVAAHLRSAGL